MTEKTMSMLENQIQKQLEELDNFKNDEAERSKAVSDLTKLLERMTEAEIANEKWYDNQERRQIERDRNEMMVEVETIKSKSDKKRVVLEIVKVGIPALVSLVTLHKWGTKFDSMLKFEETGHFTTTASRQVSLPKLKI